MRIIISTCFIILLMLTQVSSQAQEVSRSRKPFGGTLIWGTCNKPTIINPVLTCVSVSAALEELIFNRLVRINSKGEIVPDLAESWEISPDGLVYTFHLRKGVRFHDGVECTAQDVQFTYEKILDPRVHSPFQSSFELVKNIKAIDKYTFQVILKKPSVPFIYRLVREIAPKHALEGVDVRNCSFNSHPIGTGPFRFKEWTKDNQIIFEYNPDYYEGRPYLDNIIVKTYPDTRDIWTAFMRGEVDFVLFIEKEDYDVVKQDPAFKAYVVPADSYYAVLYDMNGPFLLDKRVRQAIAFGVDTKGLIERVAGGYGLEAKGPFYPGSLGFNPLVKPFEYNPEKSHELLTEAGFQDTNNDGILEKNGEEFELKVLVDARSDVYKKIAMVLRQELQEIGIKVKGILYEDEEKLYNEEFLKDNKPQAHLKFFLAGIDPEDGIEYWYSQESKRDSKMWVYENKEVDKLIELGRITQSIEARGRIYRRIHQLIYTDQPVCFLYFPFVFHAVSSKFDNMDDFFTVYMPFYTIKDWFVKDERR